MSACNVVMSACNVLVMQSVSEMGRHSIRYLWTELRGNNRSSISHVFTVGARSNVESSRHVATCCACRAHPAACKLIVFEFNKQALTVSVCVFISWGEGRLMFCTIIEFVCMFLPLLMMFSSRRYVFLCAQHHFVQHVQAYDSHCSSKQMRSGGLSVHKHTC